MHFLDTNILLYSISRDPAEAGKRERAIALIDRDDGALSAQVLQEFYVEATRATRSDRIPHETAMGLLVAWSRFRVQAATLQIVVAALEIHKAHGFSYWDSAIVAAARALDCETLYTEDLTHGRQIDRVMIVNPFR
ncbi:MAG TPA: PIN domain-containing protein [Stellaceae bacterium]|nr:PIN domain-containing protein [Stellaceae bacterium]